MRTGTISAVGMIVISGCAPVMRGVVTDATMGVPLANVEVLLILPGDSTTVIDSTRSDARGVFVLHPPGDGVYQPWFRFGSNGRLFGEVDTLQGGTRIERRYALAVSEQLGQFVYFDFQVEQPVRARLTSAVPAYPEALRQSALEGAVTLQFVVDRAGRVEPGSERVVRSAHARFTEEVIATLPHMRFHPATIHGIPVRQLVQQPFVFRLAAPPPVRPRERR